MDFLPALRDTGILRKKPFGMPDTSGGNMGELFRQIGPIASSMEDDEVRRRKDLMQFEHSLRSRGRGQQSQAPQGVGGVRGGPRTVIGPGALGPSAGQQMFRQDAVNKEGQEFKAGQAGLDRNARLTETMEEGKLRSESDMARLMQEINARKEIGAEDRGSRERVAQNELAARIRESQTARDARAAETQAEISSRERIAGMPARPTTQNASQQGNQFENRVQQLAIENPAAFAILTKDANGQFTFKPGSDPKQQDWVRNYMAGKSKPGEGMKPEPVHGKTITQRNKKTGETRQVPVK